MKDVDRVFHTAWVAEQEYCRASLVSDGQGARVPLRDHVPYSNTLAGTDDPERESFASIVPATLFMQVTRVQLQ